MKRYVICSLAVALLAGTASAQPGRTPPTIWLEADVTSGEAGSTANHLILSGESATAVIQLWMDVPAGMYLLGMDAIVLEYDSGGGPNTSFEIQAYNPVGLPLPNNWGQIAPRGNEGALPNAHFGSGQYQFVGGTLGPPPPLPAAAVLGPVTVRLDEIIIHCTGVNAGSPDFVLFGLGGQAPGYYDIYWLSPPGTWVIGPGGPMTQGTGSGADPLLIECLWPGVLGACCHADGSCLRMPEDLCVAPGDVYLGDDTTCADAQGACCISPTECWVTCQPYCEDVLGGNYLGPGTECPTQTIDVAILEPGGTIFIHTIEVVADCPTSGLRAGACAPGTPIDAWESPENASMCHNFDVPGSPPIPADFFGPGSDPFGGSVCLRGVPLGPTPSGDFGQADTLIRRFGDPFDRCDLPTPTPATVDIEILALQLESIAPITVTYNGGQNPEQWDAVVDLSEVHTDGDPSNDPPLGSLTASKTHCNGGTYTSILHVQPRFTFTKVSNPGDVRILDTGLEGIAPVMLDASTPIAWVTDVHPSLGVVDVICTDFHPGITEDQPTQDCDCNINGVHDGCEPCVSTGERACMYHGAAGPRLCLDLAVSSVEPRVVVSMHGNEALEVEINLDDPTAFCGGVTVICQNAGNITGFATAALAGSTATVTFAGGVVGPDTCTVTLDCGASACVRRLEGDVDRDGVTATTDASIIKPKYGHAASAGNAAYDYNRDGTIGTSDNAGVKPNYGHTAPECP